MANKQGQEIETEVRVNDEALMTEFIRHLQAGARKQKLSPARYLMVPENRAEMGLEVSESGRFMVSHPTEIVGSITPARFVDGKIEGYTSKDSASGEEIKMERVWTGWEVANESVSAGAEVSGKWGVEIEPIRVRAPKVTADRLAPATERGLREVSARQVAEYTGLTEVQFDIQPVLGKSHAITEGCLEAIPVILPTPLSMSSWRGTSREYFDSMLTGEYYDPMLLRFNRGKLMARLEGSLGDMGETMVSQINAYSGQAVHFAVQAIAEARMGRYLADKLSGSSSVFIDDWMRGRIQLLRSSARLAMVAYETLVNQAIGWSTVGINILNPREFAFAAQATGSFFDGVSDAGDFMAHDTNRLGGLLAKMRSDLVTLGWNGKGI